MGDLNDGPGKEFFEQKYLFFDLMSNIQGDIFEARQFMNHALFDFPENLRWTVKFKDFVAETEAEANIVRQSCWTIFFSRKGYVMAACPGRSMQMQEKSNMKSMTW